MVPYDQLVDRYHGLIYKLALGVVRNRADAEDIAQEVYVDLLRNPGALSGAQNEKAFIARCAINRAIKLRSGEQRRDRREAAVAGDRIDADPSEQVFRRELRARVADLPEGERVAVDLHYFNSFTLEETASALEIPSGTVSSRITSALGRLRKSLAAAAFAGLLAMLESELSECGADEVPGELRERLRRLGDGSPARPRWPGGASRIARVALPVALLILVAGLVAFLMRRSGEGAGKRGSGGEIANSDEGGPGASVEGTDPAPGGSSSAADTPAGNPPVAALQVCGQVVDRDMKPIPGASVTPLLELTGIPPRMPSDLLKLPRGTSTTTNASGEFAVPLLEDSRASLQIHVEGFPDAFIRSKGPGDRVLVVMCTGVTLEVHVTEADGKAAPGIPLQLAAGRQENPDVVVILEGKTDEAGLFIFAAPAGGMGIVRADGCVFSMSQNLVLPGRGTVRLEIILGPVLALTGRVTNRETGEGIGGARVGLTERDGKVATTGMDGRYELSWRKDLNTPIGIRATADGYGEQGGQLGEGGTFDFQMSACDAVSGRVVDRAGKPVAGASVAVQGNRPGSGVTGIRHSARTAADGRFTIGDLAADQAHRLTVRAAHHGEFQRLLALHRDGRSGPVDIGDIVLPVAGSASGVFLAASGAPLEKRQVSLLLVEPKGEMTVESVADAASAPVERRTVRTDDQGRFEFEDLGPGRYELCGTDADNISVSLEIELSEGQALANETLQLKAVDLVRVRIVDPQGNPLSGVSVGMHTDAGLLTRVSDADGTMEVRASARSIKPAYALRGMEPLLLLNNTEFLETAPGVIEVRMVATPARTATGVVVDADGKAVSDAPVLIRLKSGRLLDPVYSRDDGSFQVRAPVGSDVELELRPFQRGKVLLFGGTPWPADVTKDLRIVAAVAGTTNFTVEVVNPDGKPVRGVFVYAESGRAGTVSNGNTGADGRFEFHDFLDIPQRISIDPPGIRWLNARVLRRQGEATLRVVLRPGVPTSGTVRFPDGAQAASYHVVAERDGETIDFGGVDAQGRFTVLLDPARGPSQRIVITVQEPAKLKGELVDPEPGAQDLVIPVSAR